MVNTEVESSSFKIYPPPNDDRITDSRLSVRHIRTGRRSEGSEKTHVKGMDEDLCDVAGN